MSSRERASTIVLALFIAAAAWFGALGCIANYYQYHAKANVAPDVYETMTLERFHAKRPSASLAGHKDVDGMRIEAYVHEYAVQESRNGPLVQRKRWYYFHENRLVSWSDYEDWSRAARLSIRLREQEKANAAEEQRMLERAKAEEADRNAPMGDAW